jgi:hypothetical protein
MYEKLSRISKCVQRQLCISELKSLVFLLIDKKFRRSKVYQCNLQMKPYRLLLLAKCAQPRNSKMLDIILPFTIAGSTFRYLVDIVIKKTIFVRATKTNNQEFSMSKSATSG